MNTTASIIVGCSILLLTLYLVWSLFLYPYIRLPYTRSTVPDASEVRVFVSKLTSDDSAAIQVIKDYYDFTGSLDLFTLLAALTAITIKRPIAELTRVVLREYLDSLGLVQYILVLEELMGAEITDEVALTILTFGDVLHYAEKAPS